MTGEPENLDVSGQAFLVTLIVTTMILGMLVLIMKSDYRINDIVLSNEDYYPNVEVSSDSE